MQPVSEGRPYSHVRSLGLRLVWRITLNTYYRCTGCIVLCQNLNFDKSLVHFRHVIEASDDCELDLKIRNLKKLLLCKREKRKLGYVNKFRRI